MKGDVTDCLIGNLTYDFKPMYDGMSKARQNSPSPLKHGAPYTSWSSWQLRSRPPAASKAASSPPCGLIRTVLAERSIQLFEKTPRLGHNPRR